jgi:DNA-binding response OmpR family regulator
VSRDDVNQNISGEEFRVTFTERTRALGLEELVKIRFFGRTFYELCEEARSSKKPIIILTLRDQEDETIRYAVNAFSNDTAQHQINEQFLVYGMFSERVEQSLS